MVFHPVTQEVTRALRARRQPPPPVVPGLKKKALRQFAQGIFRDPARREIAEGLLTIAIRLDVLGFFEPRDQLLLLAGCGLSAVEITDSLERRQAAHSGAGQLLKKARSTVVTPMEKALSRGVGRKGGVGLREQKKPFPRATRRSFDQAEDRRQSRKTTHHKTEPSDAGATLPDRPLRRLSATGTELVSKVGGIDKPRRPAAREDPAMVRGKTRAHRPPAAGSHAAPKNGADQVPKKRATTPSRRPRVPKKPT